MKSLDFTFKLVPHGFLKGLSLCWSPHKCLIRLRNPLNFLLQLVREKENKPLVKYFLFTFDHRNSWVATRIRLNEALYVLHLKVIELRSVWDREISAQLQCSLYFLTCESLSGTLGTGNWVKIPEWALMGPRCLHIHLFCVTRQVTGTKEQDALKTCHSLCVYYMHQRDRSHV